MAASSASASSASGIMMFLPSQNKIVHEAVLAFCTDPMSRKTMDMRISDFDGVRFQLAIAEGDTNKLTVSLLVPFFHAIPKSDVDAFMASKYGSRVTTPASAEFNVAVAVSADEGAVVEDAESVAAAVAELGVGVIGSLFRPALQALAAGGKPTDVMAETRQVDYRPSESVWLVPRADRLTVVWSLEFADVFDGALARVIASELPEMGRRVPASPPTSFYEPVSPPSELHDAEVHLGANGVGFVSMALLLGNVDTPRKLERAVGRLVLFRTYLLYHIKAAKAALHARMRSRVSSWLQVLRRAHPPSGASSKAAKTLRKGMFAVVATK